MVSRPTPRYEASSKRHQLRSPSPLYVTIGSRNFQTNDWSTDGFNLPIGLAAGFENKSYSVQIKVPYQDFELGFSAKAKVIWSNDAQAGFQFFQLDNRQLSMLKQRLDQLTTGEDTDMSAVIDTIDTSEKSQKEPTHSEPVPKTPTEKVSRKTLITSLIYGAIGLFLSYFILTSLFSLFFRLNIESAVVSRPVEQMTSAIDGVIQQIHVEPGMTIKASDPILVISDINNKHTSLAAKAELQEAKLIATQRQAEYESAIRTLATYKSINHSRLAAASLRYNSARESVEVLELNMQRKSRLSNSGLVSNSDYENSRVLYLTSKRERANARAELIKLRELAKSLEQGSYFSNNRKEIDLHESKVAVETSQKRIILAENNLLATEATRSFTLRAPYPARIINITKSEGNTVAHAEVLAVLEKIQEPVIDAFLTQKQLPLIKLGSIANVYIPALDRKLKAKVVGIDRTAAFTQDDAIRFAWQESNSKTGRVTLEMLEADDLNHSWDALAGLPAEVSFRRNFWAGRTADSFPSKQIASATGDPSHPEMRAP